MRGSRDDLNPRPKAPAMYVGLVVAGVLVSCVLYLAVVRGAFSGWPERAQFGEAFGGLNALFSGAALLGIVYALLLQQGQLEEMRRGFMLQQQPLLSLEGAKFTIDRPDLFMQPGRPGANVLSRYRCTVSVSNASDFPAVGATLLAVLEVPGDDKADVMRSTGRHIAVLAPGADEQQDAMFVPHEPYDLLFKVLRERNARALPKVVLQLAYRNLMGAAFLVQQDYSVYPADTTDADVKEWHAAVASFGVQHQPELAMFREEDRPRDLLDSLRELLAEDLGDREELEVQVVPTPGGFVARTLTSDEYSSLLVAAGSPRLVFLDTECLDGSDEQDDVPA